MRLRITVLAILFVLVAVGIPAAASGGDSLYEFFGTVETLPSGGLVGDWTVAGKTVHVSASTEIDQLLGPAKVGATVRVRGTLRADGSVDAKNVEVKTGDDGAGTPARFTAVVASMPATGYAGTWVVGGRTVHVSAATRVVETNGIPKVGSTVEVSGTERADSSVDAEEIEVRGGTGGGGGGGGGRRRPRLRAHRIPSRRQPAPRGLEGFRPDRPGDLVDASQRRKRHLRGRRLRRGPGDPELRRVPRRDEGRAAQGRSPRRCRSGELPRRRGAPGFDTGVDRRLARWRPCRCRHRNDHRSTRREELSPSAHWWKPTAPRDPTARSSPTASRWSGARPPAAPT